MAQSEQVALGVSGFGGHLALERIIEGYQLETLALVEPRELAPHNGEQPCARGTPVFQGVAGSPGPQQRLLHDVLRERAVPCQPVGKPQQIRAHRFEQLCDRCPRVRSGQPLTDGGDRGFGLRIAHGSLAYRGGNYTRGPPASPAITRRAARSFRPTVATVD